jgi:hypothetical protein
VNLTPNEAAPFEVTLPEPALADGVTVTLTSSDTSKVIVTPASIVIPQGATTPVTQPQVSGVGIGAATITAAAPGYTPGAGLVIVTLPPTVTASYRANSLQVINVSLVNTSAVTAFDVRITSVTNVTAAAPNVIALRPNTIIPMPYGTLEGGQGATRNFTFEATAGSINVPFSFIVTFEADNMPPRTAVIEVPFPRSLAFAGSPLALEPGATEKLTLNLLGNEAPAAGLIVDLRSSDPGTANVPATVTFAPGATSVSVPVEGLTPGSATITATATVVNFPAIATAIVHVGGGP